MGATSAVTREVGTLRERLAALVLQAGSVECVLSTLSALCSERAQGIRERWGVQGQADGWDGAAYLLHEAARGVTV